MSIKFIAYKCGMTSFFKTNGLVIPVTVVKLYHNYIIDIKSDNNGYYQIKTAACIKKKNIKPVADFYKKIGIANLKYKCESKIRSSSEDEYILGQILPISKIKINDKLSITGISKGKGFSGVIKRHNFKSQRATHGNSLSHRIPGSIGQCQTPGKVFKGKKMAGRMGNAKTTLSNIEVINIYNKLNVILLKGSIPGYNGNKIILKKKILN